MSAPKSYEKLTTLTSATALSATVYDPAKYYPESLANGAIGTGTSWTLANDFAVVSTKAKYVHSSGVGTATQATTDMTRTGKSGARYDFKYTVSSPTGAAVTIEITSAFAAAAMALTGLTVAGIYTVRFTAATTPGDFVLSGTSAATAQTILDDLSLLEIVEQPDHRQVKRAVITVDTAAINFCVDGTTPTVTTGTHQGHLLNVADVLTLNDVTEIRMFRCINAVTSNGAVVKVTYSFA